MGQSLLDDQIKVPVPAFTAFKKKSTAETIIDYSALTVGALSAGLAKVEVDDFAAVGKHVATNKD